MVIRMKLYTYRLDKVRFSLREDRDLSWLSGFGEITDVFSKNDSGNLSFGIVKNGEKQFFKIAGLRTEEYEGEPQGAVKNLEAAVKVYEDIRHANLVGITDWFYREDLLCAVFPWFPGECLFAHWTFDRFDRYESPESPWYRFVRLDPRRRLDAMETVLDFMAEVENCGYVAVDLYDSSVLYDFENHSTGICDIDFFRKAPTTNDVGANYWGSRRFKAPEEYELGAVIDSVTNVYTLGRLGLALLGDDRSFSREAFVCGDGLYAVFQKAASPAREDRYSSVGALLAAFRQEKGLLNTFF